MQQKRSIQAIAAFEFIKGLIAAFFFIALLLIKLDTLQSGIRAVFSFANIDTAHGFSRTILQAVNNQSLHIAIALTGMYACLRFIEAWGLWKDRSWGLWLACISVAAYLPFDIYALIRHPQHYLTWIILIVNLVILYIVSKDLASKLKARSEYSFPNKKN